MRIKIFNTEVIDCSSSYNILVPNPESIDLLLNIVLKIIESDAIVGITGIESQIFTYDMANPEIISRSLIEPEIVCRSTIAPLFSLFSWFRAIRSKFADLILYTSEEARKNKTYGLHFIPNPSIQKYIKEYNINAKKKSGKKLYYYLPEGLKGVRRIVEILKLLNHHNIKDLPDIFKDVKMTEFELRISVIWKAWAHYRKEEGIGEIFDYLYYSNNPDLKKMDKETYNKFYGGKNDNDLITAFGEGLDLLLGNLCEGGPEGREDGNKHYKDIEEVLQKYWPNLYRIEEREAEG